MKRYLRCPSCNRRGVRYFRPKGKAEVWQCRTCLWTADTESEVEDEVVARYRLAEANPHAGIWITSNASIREVAQEVQQVVDIVHQPAVVNDPHALQADCRAAYTLHRTGIITDQDFIVAICVAIRKTTNDLPD